MLYFFPFLYSFLLASFLGEIPFTAASRTSTRRYGRLSQRAASSGAINVAGLDVLRTYVCPPCANAVRRQTETRRAGAITVAIPMTEVSELWQELQWILEQLSVLLDAEGLHPASTSTTDLPTMLSGLIESGTPLANFASAPVEVSNPSATNPVFIATTMSLFAVASISLAETAPADFPEVTDTVLVSGAAPSRLSRAATTVNIPSSAASSSPVSEEMATFQLAPASSEPASSTYMTPAAEGSMCYASQTVDETTKVSQSTVTAFEVAATTSSTITDATLTSIVSNNVSSTKASSNGGIFVVTAVSSGTLPTGMPEYTFNSQSTQNIAVYYGQSGATGESTLEDQCADPNIDIVILAFVITKNYDGNYPDVNFGAACGGQTSEMMTEASGLLYCPQLEGYIDICQQTYGKKVLLSIGGSTSSLSFSSALDASSFANTLWELFGPPGSIDIQLRPFGNASVDGFDVGRPSNFIS